MIVAKGRGRALPALLILILYTPDIFAQPEVDWQRVWGGRGSDFCWDADWKSNQCYALIGDRHGGGDISSDYAIYVVDLNGDTIMSKVFNEVGIQSAYCGTVGHGDGGYLLAGEWNGFAHILRIDDEGEIVWEMNFSDWNARDFWGIKKFGDQEYILAGTRRVNGGDVLVVKINENGEIIWITSYGTDRSEYGWGLCIDSEENIVIAAQRGTFDRGYNALLLKVSADGDSLWMREYEPDVSEGLTEVVEVPGGYVAGGLSGRIGPGEITRFYLLNVDYNGNRRWSRPYDELGEAALRTISYASIDRGFLLGGSNGSLGGNRNSWLLKVDRDGEVQWSMRCGGNRGGDYGITRIIELPNFSYALGATINYTDFDRDLHGSCIALIKTAPDPLAFEPVVFEPSARIYNFRDVALDSTAVWELQLRNIAPRFGMVHRGEMIEGGEAYSFDLADTSWRIYPGDSTTVQVFFHPPSEERYTGLLRIYTGTERGITDSLTVTLSGRGVPLAVPDDDGRIGIRPYALTLSPFPNPFNSYLSIYYNLPHPGWWTMRLYDSRGSEVMLLKEGYMPFGPQQFRLDSGALPSGQYLLSLQGATGVTTRRVVMTR